MQKTLPAGPAADGLVSAQPHGHCWDGYQVAGILSPGHVPWEDVVGCTAASRTTVVQGHAGRMSLAWELRFGSWPQPSPGTGWFSSEVHPWYVHIYGRLIYRHMQTSAIQTEKQELTISWKQLTVIFSASKCGNYSFGAWSFTPSSVYCFSGTLHTNQAIHMTIWRPRPRVILPVWCWES